MWLPSSFAEKESHSIKGLLLVSNLHPGPFLNIGSSVLPYLFQAVSKRRLNAIALVPHGVSGHELNLVSQEENAKIIRWVFNGLDTEYTSDATPPGQSEKRNCNSNCANLQRMCTCHYDNSTIRHGRLTKQPGKTNIHLNSR